MTGRGGLTLLDEETVQGIEQDGAKALELHGSLAWVGYDYDENGHTDSYDLLFYPDDPNEEIQELPFQIAPPMSVHDRAAGKLIIAFHPERLIEAAEWMQIVTDPENQPHQWQQSPLTAQEA